VPAEATDQPFHERTHERTHEEPLLPSPVTRHSTPSLGFRLRVSGIETAYRGAVLILRACARHGAGRLADTLRTEDEASARRTVRTVRTVTELVAAMGALKGAFVKVGQFALVRHDLVPEAAADVLGSLRSQVPPLPIAVVRATIEADLGASFETLFAEFSEVPLGAASVAQVHWARLPGGEPVAVKVQYPWIEQSLPSDLRWVRRGLSVLTRWLGREIPDQDRLLGEFEAGLREELDFEREARVAREIAANLASERQVAVPEIIESHSSPRVLTMTYCDAVPVDDKGELARLGASPRDVLEVLGRAYAKQIFADGLFHADPHAGNLFVVDEPSAAEHPRILFVDFGLSKRLSSELRDHLRVAIYALLQSDIDAFTREIDAMGMIAPGARDEVRAAVAAMFERLKESGGGLGIPGSAVLGLKDEAVALLRQTPGLQLPNDLLLYARTLSYLFQLGDSLDPDVDLVKLSTPYLLKFLAGGGAPNR
jgi:predicted unusual protein kinase regulating ubiquinone biosynthesis (AarF/ABC1/UbiB family)